MRSTLTATDYFATDWLDFTIAPRSPALLAIAPALSPPAVIPETASVEATRGLTSLFNGRTGALAGVAIAAVAGTSLVQLANQPAQYEGTFQLLVEPSSHDAIAPATAAQQATLAAPSIDYASQIEILWSHKLLSPVVQQLQTQYADISYDTLSQKLEITHPDGQKALAITYQDTDPKKVQAVLETVSQAYLQYSRECRTSLCRELKFVEQRLPQLQKQVTVAAHNLQNLQQQHGITEPRALGEQLSQRHGVLTQQRQALQIRLTEARTQLAILQKRMPQADAELAEQALTQNDRYQSLLSQFRAIADQLTVELARPQPDSTTLQTLKQRYQNVSVAMTQAAQQPVASQLTQAIADFQTTDTADYTAVSQQQARLEWVTAVNQVQMLEISQQTIVQTEGQIQQQMKQWAVLSRDYDKLNLELKFATDNLNLYQTKRAELQQFVQPQTNWQLTAAPAVEQVANGFALSDPEHRLSVGLLLSVMLVTLLISIAEQTKPSRQPRRRLESIQPEYSWQVQPWQSALTEPSTLPTLLTLAPLTELPPHHQRTTLFLLTAAIRIKTVKRTHIAA